MFKKVDSTYKNYHEGAEKRMIITKVDCEGQ